MKWEKMKGFSLLLPSDESLDNILSNLSSAVFLLVSVFLFTFAIELLCGGIVCRQKSQSQKLLITCKYEYE